jgi:hypothetical protein
LNRTESLKSLIFRAPDGCWIKEDQGKWLTGNKFFMCINILKRGNLNEAVDYFNG